MRIASIGSNLHYYSAQPSRQKVTSTNKLSSDTFVSNSYKPAFTSYVQIDDYDDFCSKSSLFAAAVPREIFDLIGSVPSYGLPPLDVDHWDRSAATDREGRMCGYDENKKFVAIMDYVPDDDNDYGPGYMPSRVVEYIPNTDKIKTEYEMRKGWHLHVFTPFVSERVDYYEDGRTPKYKLVTGGRAPVPWKEDTVYHYNRRGIVDRKYEIKTGLSPEVHIEEYDSDRNVISNLDIKMA